MVDLVTIENTHHVGGGTPMPIGDARAIARVCAEHGVPLYLDGARIFNACTVTGATVMDYGSQADALMFVCPRGWARRSVRCWRATRSSSPRRDG